MAATAALATVQTLNPRDAVVAIVGGTMLTLALTRPRLRWVEQLTEGSESNRLWAERALTVFAFAMGGYAWVSLFVVLHKQLGWEIDTVLRGAGYFMIVYAWLVHFEPFVDEWRLNGGLSAISLYTGVAIFAASVGAIVADVLLLSSFTLDDLRLLSVAGAAMGAGWVAYRTIPRLEARMDRAGKWGQALHTSKSETPVAVDKASR